MSAWSSGREDEPSGRRPEASGFLLLLREAGVDLKRLASLARQLALALRLGELVYFEGALGSGKTAMIREVASALGIHDAVRSPSFTLANVYQGPVTVHHLDLFRLGPLAQEDTMALEEYVEGDAVTLVEWPEAGRERLGEPGWVITLEHESPLTRRISIQASGHERARRWDEAAEVAGW